jgi:hypothetical protein
MCEYCDIPVFTQKVMNNVSVNEKIPEKFFFFNFILLFFSFLEYGGLDVSLGWETLIQRIIGKIYVLILLLVYYYLLSSLKLDYNNI